MEILLFFKIYFDFLVILKSISILILPGFVLISQIINQELAFTT